MTDSIIISYNEKELISGYKQFLYRDKVKNYFQLIFENLTYEEISDPIEFQVLIDSLAAMRYITKDGFAPEEEDAFVD
ncbi:MAG: hypothetical protein IPO27_15695 [Bacteroidetes bacterium]|nr:hypothetical protein [Bacteroidota bacterium]